MAAVTHRVATPSTSNASSYVSGSFTPAVGDLPVVMVEASGTVLAAPTLTDSQGGTYTLIKQQLRNANADSQYFFVRNSLIASAVATTCTFDCTGDNATGATIAVATVSGMSRTGSSAVRQSAGNNGGSAVTPAATFAAACLTGNPVFAQASNTLNPAGLTPPSTWTEQVDTGYNTPAKGLEYATKNSGFTGTTVTWGAATTTNWGAIVVELDTSANTRTASGSPVKTLSATASGVVKTKFHASGAPVKTLSATASGTVKTKFHASGAPVATLSATADGDATMTPESGHHASGSPVATLAATAAGTVKTTFHASGSPVATLSATASGDVETVLTFHASGDPRATLSAFADGNATLEITITASGAPAVRLSAFASGTVLNPDGGAPPAPRRALGYFVIDEDEREPETVEEPEEVVEALPLPDVEPFPVVEPIARNPIPKIIVPKVSPRISAQTPYDDDEEVAELLMQLLEII